MRHPQDYYTLQFMDPSVDTSPIAPALARFFDDVLDASVSWEACTPACALFKPELCATPAMPLLPGLCLCELVALLGRPSVLGPCIPIRR